jgi:hypothetical protein
MKFLLALTLITLISGCSDEQAASAEKYVFQKTAEIDLLEKCGEDDACIQVVKENVELCMDKSNWKKYVDNSDDNEELYRFIKEFYPCFKNSEGKPYF